MKIFRHKLQLQLPWWLFTLPLHKLLFEFWIIGVNILSTHLDLFFASLSKLLEDLTQIFSYLTNANLTVFEYHLFYCFAVSISNDSLC
jgi:hypothetical protein